MSLYNLTVGRAGTGTLTIENGGYVSSANGYIGEADGSGTVTVTGANSEWKNGVISLGSGVGGEGILTIEDGGTVSSEGTSYIGRASGSEATVTVTGEHSTWENVIETLYVGGNGTGTLTVADGGIVSTQGATITIANSFGSTGTLNIGAGAGSAAVAAGVIDAPTVTFGGGTGTIVFNHTDTDYTFAADISGQGTVEVYSGTTTLAGTNSYSRGTTVHNGILQVDGGSIDQGGPSNMIVGELNGDDAALIIKNGGWVHSNEGYVGQHPGARGEVTVTGPGSRWSTVNPLSIGRVGVGSLIIADGGKVSNTYHGYIGYLFGSSGSVTVTGPSSKWNSTSDIFVGREGSGKLIIKNGGLVKVHDFLSVGNAQHASGSVTVHGAGSTLDAAQMRVGFNGTGELTLSDGGTVTVNGGTGVLRLDGSYTSSSGTLNFCTYDLSAPTEAGTLNASSIEFEDVSADGAVNFNQTDDLTISMPINGGVLMSVNQRGTGTTTLTGTHTYWGDTIVSDGLLVVDGTLVNSAVEVLSGGTLGGNGHLKNGLTVESGGTLAPGGSIGTLTVDGNLTLSSGSILEYELGGPGASSGTPGTSDRVDVSGNVALNGTLNFSQSGDAADEVAGLGYYRLMTYGTLSGDRLMIGDTPMLSDPAGYEIQTGGGHVDLFIATLGDDTLQHWQGGGTWNAANEQWLNQGGISRFPGPETTQSSRTSLAALMAVRSRSRACSLS